MKLSQAGQSEPIEALERATPTSEAEQLSASGMWLPRPSPPDGLAIAVVFTLLGPFVFALSFFVFGGVAGLMLDLGAKDAAVKLWGSWEPAFGIAFAGQLLAYIVTTAWCGLRRSWWLFVIMLIAAPVLLIMWWFEGLGISLMA